MKHVLILRANSLSQTLEMLIQQAQSLNFPVLVAADESKSQFPLGNIEKVTLNSEVVARLNLPLIQNCFWLFGDYALYVCRNKFPMFEYYWLVEQDVKLNFEKMQSFFDLFSNSDDDLIAPDLEKIDASWWTWTETMRPFVGQTWRCFFPVTRISGRAIDYLYRRRLSIFNYIKEKRIQEGILLSVPNDEAFVSSELCESGFICKDLSYYNSRLYSRDTFRFRRPLPRKMLDHIGPDNRIYHPVVDDVDFVPSLSRRFDFLSQRMMLKD